MKMIFFIIACINLLFANQIMVKKDDVTLLINGQEVQVPKDHNLTLKEGTMVCFLKGNGIVIVDKKMQLDKKNKACYQIPVKDDFTLQTFLSKSENQIVISSEMKKDTNASLTRGIKSVIPSTDDKVLSISADDKEVVIYDETYGPLPVTLNIKKPNGTVMTKVINEENPKTFFRVPTSYLENGSKIEVTNAFGDKLMDKEVSVMLYYKMEEHDRIFYDKKKHTIVDILYGTDRKQNREHRNFEDYYSGERGKLQYGVAQVSIPKSHKFGKMERPYRGRSAGIIGEHIVITKLDTIYKKDFLNILQKKLAHISEKDILVFVHGYNVTFASAIRRTAQLSYDLKFKGVPIAYSWPSQGEEEKYMKDEASVQYTVPHLVTFLKTIIESKKGDANIHLLGHSMGTRALTNAIKELSFIYPNRHIFKNIILAAPDIDTDVFEESLFPYIRKTTDQVTLYASSDDKALKISNVLHYGSRIGESGDNIFLFKGLDTVDATGVDTSFFSLKHSYFAEKEILITDLKEVIHQSLPPEKRDTLISRIKRKLKYWQLKLHGH